MTCRASAHALEARVDLAAEGDEVELRVRAHERLGGARDEEEDGAGRVHVHEDALVAAGEEHRLHVDVVLEGRRRLGAPGGVRVQRARELRGGHDDRVREHAHRDDHVDDDLVHGLAAEDEGDRALDVAAALAAAEERAVGVRGRDEVAVDGGRAEADAEAVVHAGEHRDAARGEDAVVEVGGVVDLAAEVEDVDVARGEVRGDVGAAVALAFSEDDRGRFGSERAAEVVDGELRAAEAGDRAGGVVVAGDGDAALAADDEAHVGGGHVCVCLCAT